MLVQELFLNVIKFVSLLVGSSASTDFQTCAQGYALCHTDARCVDYSEGFCCECETGFYGNGQNCLPHDLPQRLSGKVTGILNGIELGEIDLHSYVVVADGRQYTAISKIPDIIGHDMQTLISIGGIVGWEFAARRGKAKNGFELTGYVGPYLKADYFKCSDVSVIVSMHFIGGVFNCTTQIEFPQTGHSTTIQQQFIGANAFGYFQVQTEIKGTVPVLLSGSQLQMNDYFEEYNRVLPGNLLQEPCRSS